jgi:hypothetical protein
VNGATGVVKDIVYAEDKKPPDLPIMVMVDFGEAYTGPSFFPDDIENGAGFRFRRSPLDSLNTTRTKSGLIILVR